MLFPDSLLAKTQAKFRALKNPQNLELTDQIVKIQTLLVPATFVVPFLFIGEIDHG